MLVNVFALDDDLSGIRPPNDQCHDVSEEPFLPVHRNPKSKTHNPPNHASPLNLGNLPQPAKSRAHGGGSGCARTSR